MHVVAQEGRQGLHGSSATEEEAARPSNLSKAATSLADPATDQQPLGGKAITTTVGKGAAADPCPLAQDAPVRPTGGGPARGKGTGLGSRAERSAHRQAVEATVELDQARAAIDAAKKRAARAEAEAASEAKARKAAERQV
jgi:hypothetical protein